MAFSVSISRNYHGNLTSHFYSLFSDNYAKYSGVFKNVYKDEWHGVLTFFVLAKSTQVKWYKLNVSVSNL